MANRRARGLLSIIGAVLSSGHAGKIKATEALWQGRTLRSDATGSVMFSWEGVSTTMKVGPGATKLIALIASEKSGPRFHVILDEESIPVSNITLPAGVAPAPVILVDGLDSSTEHMVTLWHITDPITLDWPYLASSNVTITGFESDAGSITPVQSLKRSLLFIGDSITAGNQIDEVTCEDDHWGSYGAQLCRYFNANCTTSAISGKGLLENCCDDNETMAELWDRALPAYPTTKGVPLDVQADAVFVNLGTNDQAKVQAQNKSVHFSAAYFRLLIALGKRWPQVTIFCGVGPISHAYYPWVEDAVRQATKRRIRVSIINFSTPLDQCNHPAWSSHTAMFRIAQPLFAEALGWEAPPEM